MKRSTCLSAFLAVFSLTSIASAAENPSDNAQKKQAGDKPVLVAQNGGQPSDEQNTTAAPPADPQEQPQPAVSVGATTPPAADKPAESPEEPKKEEKPRPFAGTQIFSAVSMTTNTVFRGQTQYDDPTVESNTYLLPRYTINPAFQLRGRMIVSYEMTNSDETKYRNEPTLSDAGLQLFYKKIPEIATVKPLVALNVSLPTSKLSRARTMIFSPGATFQLSKAFENVLHGEIDIISSLSYSHPIYSSKNAEVTDPRAPGAFQCAGGNGCQDLLSGKMNPSDALSYSAILTGTWGKWSPALMYLGASQWVYHPKDINESDVVAGAPSTPVKSSTAEPTSVRQTHYFSAWLDYEFNGWFTGEIGYWNAISALGEDGQRANVIFSRYQDTRVYLGINLNIDNLLKQLEGGPTEAGIVRAQNHSSPFGTF